MFQVSNGNNQYPESDWLTDWVCRWVSEREWLDSRPYVNNSSIYGINYCMYHCRSYFFLLLLLFLLFLLCVATIRSLYYKLHTRVCVCLDCSVWNATYKVNWMNEQKRRRRRRRIKYPIPICGCICNCLYLCV